MSMSRYEPIEGQYWCKWDSENSIRVCVNDDDYICEVLSDDLPTVDDAWKLATDIVDAMNAKIVLDQIQSSLIVAMVGSIDPAVGEIATALCRARGIRLVVT